MARLITCKTDTRELDRMMNNISRKGMNKAVAQSLNRAAKSGKVGAAKQIRDKLKFIPAAKVKEALITTRQARSSEHISEQRVEVSASTKGLSLRLFKPKQTGAGVAVKLPEGTSEVKHAFVPKSGLVFRRTAVRKNVQRRRVRKSELPIEKQVYKGYKLLLEEPDVNKLAAQKFEESIATQLSYNINKLVLGK